LHFPGDTVNLHEPAGISECSKAYTKEISTNSAEYKSTHLYITEYSSGFILLLVKPGTQHVKSPFLLLVLVDKIGLLPLLSGLHVKPLKTRARVLKRTRVFIGLKNV
jgi:hypothetical protein